MLMREFPHGTALVLSFIYYSRLLLLFVLYQRFEKSFWEYHQSIKQFGPRLGPAFGVDLGSNCIKSYQQTALVDK